MNDLLSTPSEEPQNEVNAPPPVVACCLTGTPRSRYVSNHLSIVSHEHLASLPPSEGSNIKLSLEYRTNGPTTGGALEKNSTRQLRCPGQLAKSHTCK